PFCFTGDFMNEKVTTKQRWIWFYVLLGGATAWLIHLMMTYTIGEFACIARGQLFEWGGLSATHWFIYFISAFCLISSIGALALSIRPNGVLQNDSFIRNFGIFAILLFTLAIIAQTIPIIILSGDC